MLNENKNIKLEFGATTKRDTTKDWFTVDINMGSDLFIDLSKTLPLPDNSIDMIYSSHLLEHFSYPNPMMNLLKECYRILKPNGVFDVCVPNAKIYAKAYLNKEKNPDISLKHIIDTDFNSKIDYLNHAAYMRGEHKYMFDEENLPIILKKAGFKNIRLREFDLNLDRKERVYESIYVRGIK
jgi:predicted SAM-dependent methyltransferase